MESARPEVAGLAGKASEAAATSAPRDPIMACWLVTIGFFVLAAINLWVPGGRYFDEPYYVNAARALIAGSEARNFEHPMLGKELIALSIMALGDHSIGWRMGSVMAGSVGLFAAVRALWWYSHDRLATLCFAALLSSSILLFTLSRIAMLDIFMFAFAALACLAYARNGRTGRGLWLSGVAIGLSFACKWSVAPLWLVLGSAHLLRSRNVVQSALAFGLVPLAAYLLTFVPGYLVDKPLPADPLTLQWKMATLIAVNPPGNTETSVWWQWLANTGPVWLLTDGPGDIFRLSIMAANPLSNLLVVPATAWALTRRRYRFLGIAVVALLAFWAVNGKAYQYVHHYLLAMTFGLAAASLLLSRWRPAAIGVSAISLALFAFFLPGLWGKSLAHPEYYTWYPGWAPPASRLDSSGR